MANRVVLIVMDSLGVGAMPDADEFGDLYADTFGHILDSVPNLNIPNLRKLGIGNIEGVAGGKMVAQAPIGAFGRAKEVSKGKDTITGHWEIAGIKTITPFRTYPHGFPDAFIQQFENAIGVKVIGNYPASGTVIIDELGPIHEATGQPIVYTSADSVFQIAANINCIPLQKLYEICEIARKMLQGEYACGRVIARPYTIENEKRIRTSDRRDYAVSPPEPTILNAISCVGKTVLAIGKISDIFNQSGVTSSIHTVSNLDGIQKTIEAINNEFSGLLFTNLVDFDSKYGHRRDPIGYALAIEEFDQGLTKIISALKKDDVLILCADHGNDPTHPGWDHTREYIPILIYGKKLCQNVDLGTRSTFADIGATIADFLDVKPTVIGTSFRNLLEVPAG